jgi:hypothetical protein
VFVCVLQEAYQLELELCLHAHKPNVAGHMRPARKSERKRAQARERERTDAAGHMRPQPQLPSTWRPIKAATAATAATKAVLALALNSTMPPY